MIACPTCKGSKVRISKAGWALCYYGCPPVKVAQGVESQEQHVAPPPPSIPLTDDDEGYLQERLEMENTWFLPAPIKSTREGILFQFPHEKYWQVRRRQGEPRWRCPPGPFSTPYLCIPTKVGTLWDRGDETVERDVKEVKTLFVVEGIMDALKLYQSGYSALATLTTLPRREQLVETIQRFSRAVWMHDGDVPLRSSYMGMRVLEHLFDKVTHISLPRGADPCSLPVGLLEQRIALVRRD